MGGSLDHKPWTGHLNTDHGQVIKYRPHVGHPNTDHRQVSRSQTTCKLSKHRPLVKSPTYFSPN